MQLTLKQYQFEAEHYFQQAKCAVTIDSSIFFSVCFAKHVSTMLFFVRLNTFHFHCLSDRVLGEWRNEGTVSNLLWNHVRALLLKKHKHQHVSSKYVKRHTSKAKLNEPKHKLSPVREISESVSAPNLHGYANGNF